MKIFNNYNLAHFNTFNLDVSARYFISFEGKDDITELVKIFNEGEKFYILGEGSNTLFTGNYEGFILHNGNKKINILREDEKEVLIEAEGGVVWDDLVKYCVDKGFGGVENLSWIPGTTGAAPVQNIGAYGVELKDTLYYLETVSLKTGDVKIFYNKDCKFSYRNSIFKESPNKDTFITRIVLKLHKNFIPDTSYKAIRDYLEQHEIRKTDIKTVRDAVIKIRQSKLPDPSSLGNAGSFFKNPVVSADTFTKLKSKFDEIVFYRLNENEYKIPAGWLIEKAGLKGYRDGNTGTHNKQALVIVNYGEATGNEIVTFAEKIRDKVFSKFNIQLEFEVNIIF